MEEAKERKEKMIPLFLSDLDGTLVHEENMKISSADVEEIKLWKKRGFLFGLVTGRDRVFCLDLLKQYDITPDCLITCNGALTFWKEKKIDASLIDLQISEQILKELKKYQDIIDSFFTAEDGYNYFLSEDYERIKTEFSYLGRIKKESLESLIKRRSDGLAKISIAAKSLENVQKLLPEFKNKFLDVEVMATSDDYIEITRKSVDKAHAMKKMIEYKNLDIDDVIFIGDGSNDIPLFNMLKCTYVMSSAPNEIKKHANLSVSHVADAIKKERENR